MNFNFPQGKVPEPPHEPEIGCVYSSKNTHRTVAWLVLSITGNTVHMLGIDHEGQVSSTQSYGVHALRNRELIGRVDLSKLEFDIEPV